MITEMRGADFIVFRSNYNGKIRNLVRFLMVINSFAGHFFEITDAVFLLQRGTHVQFVLFDQICAFFFSRVHNAGYPGVE